MPERPVDLPDERRPCLLVGISPDPFALRVIEAGEQMAKDLGLAWVAVHVGQGRLLSGAERAQLLQNMSLAAKAGAETVTLQDSDLVRAFMSLAQERPVGHVLMGSPGRWPWTAGQRLARGLAQQADLQLHVLGRPAQRSWSWPVAQAGALQYWYCLWITGLLSVFSFGVEAALGYESVGFFFLCALLLQSLFLSLGPLFFSAVLSALVWDYFFIPPHFSLAVSDRDDAFMIAGYFVAVITTGVLTARIRRDQLVLAARGRRSELLFRLVHTMATGHGKKPLREIADMLKQSLQREFMVFLSQPSGGFAAGWDADQAFPLWHRDLKAAQWAMEHRQACGWSTAEFPQADALYIPLVGKEEVVGLLVCRPLGLPFFSFEEEDLLKGACAQLSLWLERERLEERSREAKRLGESEKLHQTLLNSLSHELRTPLTAMLGSAAGLRDEAALHDAPRRLGLLDGLADAGERLNRVIDNLLDMARLSSGALTLKLDWQDPAELLHLTVGRLRKPLSAHKLLFDIPADLPLVRIDYRLMEHALSNLILNAAAYSPSGSRITVAIRAGHERLEWSVADQGPGIPDADLERVFDKFYRVVGSPTGGLGLGLNIVHSLVAAHGGEARARNNARGGAEFTLSLPLVEAPPIAEEAVA